MGNFVSKVKSEVCPVLDIDTFRALCKKVAEEKDPFKLEVLKERMRLLLAESPQDRDSQSNVFVN